MRVLAAAFAALIALGMAWRGYRRGALATLAGWLPLAASILILLVAARAAWADLEHFAAACQSGALAAAFVYFGGTFLLWSVRRRVAAAPAGGAHFGLRIADCGLRARGHQWGGTSLGPEIGNRQSAIENPQAPCGGLARLNRIAGAALGVVCAAVLCLGLACLASAAAFSCSAAAEPEPARPAHSARWANALREACNGLADAANFGLVSHIPLLCTYGSEVRALVRLLNAPDAKLRRLAARRGLPALADLPEVKAALADDAYVALITRLGEGDVTAIPRLAESPTTRRVLACPQIRHAVQGLSPSALLRDLDGAAEPNK